LAAGCGGAASTSGRARFVWPALAAKELANVGAEAYPNASAVYLAKDGELGFANPNDPSAGFVFTVHARVLILTPAGRIYGRVTEAVDWQTTLQDVAARSFDAAAAAAGGAFEAMPLPSGALTYRPLVDDGVLYSDNRLAAFDIPGAEPGRVVEYRYTLRSRGIYSLPQWTFDAEIPVRQSTLRVAVPRGWVLRVGFSENGGPVAAAAAPAPEVTASADGATQVMTWRLGDLGALEPDPMGLPVEHLARRVLLTLERAPGIAFGQWSDLAAYYRRLTEDLGQAPDEAVAALRRSRPAVDAASIFAFVRDSIRYVAVHQGIGAFRPHKPAEVFGARLGDCKDMANLLVTLLRHEGISAFPVLVSTRDHNGLHPDVPTVAAFNHVIVAVVGPGQTRTFIDPTAKHVPFGALPWQVQGRPALVVTPDGGELVTLPLSGIDDNVVTVAWRLDEGESALTIRAKGKPAMAWRGLAGVAPDHPRLCKAIEAGLDAIEAAKVTHAAIKVDDAAVEINAVVATPHLTLAAGGARVLPLGPFLGDVPEVRVPAERRSPVQLGLPGRFAVEVTYPFAKGAQVAHAPQKTELDLALGSFLMEAKADGQKVEIHHVYTRKLDAAPASALGELRQLTEAMAAASREAVVWR
jgi:transglutaminase-like putative cysteine protease